MERISKKKDRPNSATSGVAWKFAERFCAQGVSFIVSLVLARMLMPEEYGTISIVLVFINIADVFVTNGLGLSLIQKKESDDLDFSSMFYCSIFLGAVLYSIIFISAPFIGEFYNNDLLVPVTRVLGIKVLIASVNSIQQAYISKKLLFQKFFLATLIGTVISGVVGIGMAYAGMGVWALVMQYLTNSFIDTICLFIAVKWYPKLVFSWKRASALIGYAWKIMASSFVNITFGQLKSLIIGKIYCPADLAYYEKGNFFPQNIMCNFDSAISDVSFPFMAKCSDDPRKLKTFARKSLRVTSYIVMPMMMGLLMVAENLIVVLLTEKWRPAIVFLQIMCIYWMMQPIQTIDWQILKASGKADICLKLELVKKGISLVCLLLVMHISVEAIVWNSVAMAVISVIANIIAVRSLINYNFREQFADILPSILLCIGMGIVVYPLKFLNCPRLAVLILQCVIGALAYVLLSVLSRNKEFAFLLDKVKNIYHNKFKQNHD